MKWNFKNTASQWKDRLPELPELELDERELAALAAAGVVVLWGTIHAIHRRRMYKRVVAKELKKQLAPINQKLDAIQSENNQLHAELAQQTADQAEE